MMEFVFGGFTFLFVGLIMLLEIGFNFFIVYMIGKIFIEAIKRNKSHKNFSNNVVYYSSVEGNGSQYENRYRDVSKSKLAKFNTDDINTLKKYFYDIFYRFEVAYNRLDYNEMKLLSTRQLYENYHTGITLDLKVGRKKVIDSIVKKDVIIYELDTTLIKQVASVMIEVSYINYMMDKHGYIVSGNRNEPTTQKFEVQFRKDFELNEKTHCPNCGAILSGDMCEYCKAKVNSTEFKICSIRKIMEK